MARFLQPVREHNSADWMSRARAAAIGDTPTYFLLLGFSSALLATKQISSRSWASLTVLRGHAFI